MSNAKIENVNDAHTFATAGRAVFTIHNPATGGRFTYKVEENKKAGRARFFVSVLTGPQNTTDFSFLGCVFQDGAFAVTRASRIGKDAPSARAFYWLWRALTQTVDLKGVEFWHEGRCGKCARALTVPESIHTGLGPVCASKIGAGE